jgi:alpha-beta hydrolase superfamily lysophospholipase
LGRGEEIRAAGGAAGDALAAVVGTVRDVHRAVAGRVFAALGPVAVPVRILHDTISGGVYATVHGAHALLPRAVSAVAAGGAAPGQPSLSASAPGSLVLAGINGLWGDTLRGRHPSLALEMTVRAGGTDTPVTAQAVAAAYPRAGPRIALFVHGLCETEQFWALSSRRYHGTGHTSHGSRLARDLGYTPVYLRYNTGLRVSDNGARLAVLLEDLVTRWPVPVEELVLVGHSMGGLVVRSACQQAATGPQRWTPLVRHVFCLATPHLGAPLEKGANVAAWLMAQFPETRPAARLLNSRSAGIKDMRFGALVEADWRGNDPDEFLRDRCTEIPFLPHAAYYFIAATVTARRGHPLGRVLGDLIVQFPSASGEGRRRRIPFDVEHGRHLGGLHHFDLLNHPDVYRQMHRWLAADAGWTVSPHRPSR